jgi:GT2 family glycosyltransferase
VGRLETRKNQLMLLKALEDSSLSIVFLNGGVDSHPSYLNAAKAFKRLGKTYFLGRLTEELLLSAYAGARVHALPSWCDLPGLVTLDAAKVGTPVVCSKYTTVPDYLGDDAFYCDPSDSRDIFEKVQIAYQQPKNKNLIEKSNSFSWKHSAKELVGVYQEVIAENKSNNIPSVKTNPKLSVLLCSYNRERKVEKCLAALAAQSLASSEYEVICVNDGSTDGTGDLMKQYLETNQGVYIEHKTNRALAAARNSAIEAARGDYLVFINDDTYPTADFLVKHLEALERKNDTYAAIVGDLPFVEGLNDRILSKTLLDHDLYFCFNKLDRIKTNPFWAFVTGNLSISKKAFTETGIRFDESFLRYGYEDLECGYRLSKLGLKVYYVPEAIALHDHKITIAEFARRAENNAINMLQCAVKHKGDKLFTSTLFGVPEITKQVLDFWRKSSLNTLPTISNLESQISQLEDEKVSVVKARGVDVTGLISNVAIGIESLGALVRQLTYVKTLEEHSEMYQSLIGEDHKSSIVKRALV